MRRLIFLLLALMSISVQSFSDIIITKKSINNSYEITNLDEYPDLIFFAVYRYDDISNKSHFGYERVKHGWIKKHAFCNTYVYAVKKEYLEKRNIKDIDWKKDSNVISSNLMIKPDSDKTEDSKIIEIKHFYSITSVSNSKVKLHEDKKVTRYKRDGQKRGRARVAPRK